MKKVLVFGTFDPLHDGHKYLFEEAKKLGDHVTVVVARDSFIRGEKQREPYQFQDDRLLAVLEHPSVDEAILGDEYPAGYSLLATRDFDVLAVGYDQYPSDQEIREILQSLGKSSVELVRLPPYKPEQFKSSLIRKA